MQLGDFLEEMFAKAVVINLRDSELCIYSRVSCSDSTAGVNVDEVQLSTILSAMNVCKTSLPPCLRPLMVPLLGFLKLRYTFDLNGYCSPAL